MQIVSGKRNKSVMFVKGTRIRVFRIHKKTYNPSLVRDQHRAVARFSKQEFPITLSLISAGNSQAGKPDSRETMPGIFFGIRRGQLPGTDFTQRKREETDDRVWTRLVGKDKGPRYPLRDVLPGSGLEKCVQLRYSAIKIGAVVVAG